MDSRVVRIELRNPPPPVNFSEWDGLIRLLFNRKHKKLHSVLTTKSVLGVRSDRRLAPVYCYLPRLRLPLLEQWRFVLTDWVIPFHVMPLLDPRGELQDIPGPARRAHAGQVTGHEGGGGGGARLARVPGQAASQDGPG